MKYLLLLLLFPFSARSQSSTDILHYHFGIYLNDTTDVIVGTAEISFILKEKDSHNQVRLDLANKNSDGKGMLITGPIACGNQSISSFKHEKNSLWIDLPAEIKSGDTVHLGINYKGIPSDGLSISKSKFGKRTFFSDNWPNRAHNWLPCKDEPGDKAAVDFIVTAPNHYQVISNGIQVEESNLAGGLKLTHYREENPLPTKIMVIGVAEFAVNHAGMVNDCIPVSSWVFPENKAEGFDDYAIARDVLEFFTKYIGPYPYKKLANVQSKTTFGGMENASAIFYFENSVNGKKDQEALIAHEIVHQWFGNTATEKSFAHLWLSEGFATYLTHLYLESKYGTDSLAKRMTRDRREIIEFVKSNPRPVVDYTKDYMSLLNENSYQKGSWILHMLRMQLMDDTFQKGIRKYFETYAGRNADTKDLQKIFEEVSGKNLDKFFNQWLYTPENPKLDVSWSYDPKKNEVHVHLVQMQKNLFEFQMNFGLITNTGAGARYSKLVSQREHNFIFSMPEKPKSLVLDAVIPSVLFEATVKENK